MSKWVRPMNVVTGPRSRWPSPKLCMYCIQDKALINIWTLNTSHVKNSAASSNYNNLKEQFKKGVFVFGFWDMNQYSWAHFLCIILSGTGRGGREEAGCYLFSNTRYTGFWHISWFHANRPFVIPWCGVGGAGNSEAVHEKPLYKMQ